MQVSIVCIKCNKGYSLWGYPWELKKIKKVYKCNSCNDAEQLARIRFNLMKLIDPDTGSRFRLDKIELRVKQWLIARNKIRSVKEIKEQPK
jgi:hypothetical protein